MKVIMTSGRMIDLPWSQANLTGYVAAACFIEPSDLHQMIVMLDRDPERLRASLVQWMARFPEERVPPSKPGRKPHPREGIVTEPKKPELSWEEREAFRKGGTIGSMDDIDRDIAESLDREAKAAAQPLGYREDDCPSCHGSGQPGGVKGGQELGQCGQCGGSGKMRVRGDWMAEMLAGEEPDMNVPQALLDQIADRRDAKRYRWLRDGNVRMLEDFKIEGGDALDGICDAKGDTNAL